MKLASDMIEADGENLRNFFSAYSAARVTEASGAGFPQELERFFQDLPFFGTTADEPNNPNPPASELSYFFTTLQSPLEAAKEHGGRVNFWSVAGLNGYEVRTANALAGLWRYDFGGRTSRQFVANYLKSVIHNRNWEEELRQGYGVHTEVNPMGDMEDRVDLIIETNKSLIGIEIKIRAKPGNKQLERYKLSLGARARQLGKECFVIFLAPYKVKESNVYLSSWKTVSNAARSATNFPLEDRSLIHHAIAKFGEHVFNY